MEVEVEYEDDELVFRIGLTGGASFMFKVDEPYLVSREDWLKLANGEKEYVDLDPNWAGRRGDIKIQGGHMCFCVDAKDVYSVFKVPLKTIRGPLTKAIWMLPISKD